ncbi:carboxypeptidase M32 [Alkalicoccus urumqiensis]|uniref:Metal-dependent carboxypeptidase n=1 Tax=Alkalicoccus urumqiensis TaxID=1548213 RepID=A0A2P6MDT7_ALKUR|nr:carboxypeptidase M32 [Alkalicoccus urumqiensis]PRO64424.1 carboxypeptidase M32 [Alkalicoccus urumqiensis]
MEKQFYSYMQKTEHLKEAAGLMAWDLRTYAPKKGAAGRGEAVGTLSEMIFERETSEEMRSFLNELPGRTDNKVTEASLRECRRTFDKLTNVPQEEYKAFVVLTTQSEKAWEEAKETGDFQTFAPYLKDIVDFQRRYAEWKGYEGEKYNALLDDFEPGLTTEKIDDVFAKLKQELVPLVEQISTKKNPPADLFSGMQEQDQAAFSQKILEAMHYDFDAGRLDKTVHPFAIGLNSGDVRVTTKYDENDFRTAVFGTIHEGGHALYEQNIGADLYGTLLSGGASMGIHESQSLFWENFVGRHYAFWKSYYPLLQDAHEPLKNVPLDSFYPAVNQAGPSLIRIEADELTYCLHIILRYELEKALIRGELEVDDLPEAWADKMEELLGIRPENDSEGVLQDVHWPAGMFGYFPSYAFGYIYAAQLKEAMLQDLPEFNELLEEGNLTPVKEWLTENVHRHGRLMDPEELLKSASGWEMTPEPLIRYLTDKYTALYNLKESEEVDK